MITGATGFIGTHLIERLLKENANIYAVVRPNSPHINRLPANINIINLEIEQITKLKDILKVEIDCFYHLCWNGIRKPLRDDYAIQKKNYDISLQALNTALHLNTKAFIATGSQAEYGSIKGVISEDTICCPDTAYGIYKKRTYDMLSKLARDNHIKFIWGRVFSAYGEYDYENSLIMYVIDCLLRNKPIELTACEQQWDYVYVKDVADAMTLLWKTHCPSGCYNIAYGKSKTLREYIESIMEEFPINENSVLFGAIPYGKTGALSIQPTISKLSSTLNWKPDTDFKKGIRKTIQFKEQEEKNENNQHTDTNL